MNIWIVYRASDRRVMAMLQLLYEATNYIADHQPEEHKLLRGDPANLEKGKDWFTVPAKYVTHTPTESGEFRNA
jgi:hypothetical protein